MSAFSLLHHRADQAAGGHSTAPWCASGIAIDSRTLSPGDLFIALSGPRHDGHDWIAAARDRGAAAAVTAQDSVVPGLPLLRVADTMAALWALARQARAATQARVALITGSVGKTSVKDTLACALRAQSGQGNQGAVHATPGTLNNHIGLPLTLARLPERAAFAVLEAGMSQAGEIRALSLLTRPDVAVITAVTAAHLAWFRDLGAIADAKAEIFDGSSRDGWAVLPQDSPFFPRLRAAARAAGIAADRILGVGAAPEAAVRLLAFTADAENAAAGHVIADCVGHRLTYRLATPERHRAISSLLTVAAAMALGTDASAAAAALASWRPAAGRGSRESLTTADGGTLTLIDDSYNASPASMAAALEALGLTQPGRGGRRIAVLGDMLELGTQSDALHRALAARLQAANVDLMLAAGPAMTALATSLPASMRGTDAATGPALALAALAATRSGDVVLVKGSRGMAMDAVAEALRQRASASTAQENSDAV